jgi:hypothetical protein
VKMSEDGKRSIAGGLTVKPPISDDRNPSSAAAATPPSGKRVIIKSADMLPEIQKEAVDTAIAVSLSLSLSLTHTHTRARARTLSRGAFSFVDFGYLGN